ncbi:EAL domain-containing protein [Roseobacteraceae bacterium S113]
MSLTIILSLSLIVLGLAFFAATTAMRARRLDRRVEELTRTNATLSHMVDSDDLTSSYSRRYMREVFSSENQNGRNALCFVDLDNFKSVNDGYGHKSGDALLKAISNRLMDMAQPDEIVFRIGGDEFGIYMRNRTIEEATERAEDFLAAIADVSIVVDGIRVSRTCSMGVARIEQGQDLVGALYYADEAQYAAKTAGGQSVRANTGATLRSMIQRRTGPRAEDLAAAIAREEVTYFVQPIFDTLEKRPIGVEALIRWQRADGRVILPEQFLDVMTGNYNARITPPLAAANRIAEAFTGSDAEMFCSFNISSGFLERNLSENDDWVTNLLNGLNPARTVFEIVEYAAIRNTEHARLLLNRLRKEGVRVALDDFGTGFNNLERLQQLNVDIVKIDRRFVSKIDKPGADLGILRALLDLSRDMGFAIIAEGVETEAELATLQDVGIYNAQGFLLGRPEAADYWVKKFGLAPNGNKHLLSAQ